MIKLRKLLVTGASIYFLIYKIQEFMCPDYTDELESYQTVSTVIKKKYVNTLETYLMDNSEFYHLTQVFTYDQESLKKRFFRLLRHHYLHFVDIEDSKHWDAEHIAEIKSNFTGGVTNNTYLSDKVILYNIQEMIAQGVEYQACFYIEMGMNDLLRNYSTQALNVWYHWRGLILETDLIHLHNYVSQPVHTTVLSQVSLCTDENPTFHYYAINPYSVKPEFRKQLKLVHRVPCFPLTYFGYIYSTEHIEYFILGPRCDLLPSLRTVLQHKNTHFILIIIEREGSPNAEVMELMTKHEYSVYYDSQSLSKYYHYVLYYKYIEKVETDMMPPRGKSVTV
ncbi:hypothetical protein WDU94_014794 [Cyamophila willieti]